jgi:PPOX class probable F420-dependent enzyme
LANENVDVLSTAAHLACNSPQGSAQDVVTSSRGSRLLLSKRNVGPLKMAVESKILSDDERGFVAHQKYAHLATADRRAVPHVVPVCFAISAGTLYITIDEKPKRYSGKALKRLRNIAENPAVAVVIDRYDEDWAMLGWVMLHGHAEILTEGTEHQDAQALLRSRYPQLRAMQIAQHPVIAVRIERTTSWGNLSVPPVS